MYSRFHYLPRLYLRVSMLVVVLAILLPVANGSADLATDEGKMLAMERSKGNCLACHVIADGELPGNIGPPLFAMQDRFPERATLTEQICDATIRNPNSRMPPFCRHGILTEDEVDLIVDYLYTL
jgi:L-cysteine S-thiosulfotransferase